MNERYTENSIAIRDRVKRWLGRFVVNDKHPDHPADEEAWIIVPMGGVMHPPLSEQDEARVAVSLDRMEALLRKAKKAAADFESQDA